MRSALRDVAVPAFGVPLEAPRIPPATYERRCREAYAGAGCGWLIVWLAAERLLADVTAVDNTRRCGGAGLTARLIQFREIPVNSVD